MLGDSETPSTVTSPFVDESGRSAVMVSCATPSEPRLPALYVRSRYCVELCARALSGSDE